MLVLVAVAGQATESVSPASQVRGRQRRSTGGGRRGRAGWHDCGSCPWRLPRAAAEGDHTDLLLLAAATTPRGLCKAGAFPILLQMKTIWSRVTVGDDMFDPIWKVRHGTIMALRDILTHQGACAGVYFPELTSW